MRFRKGAKLDPSQVEDYRGQGGGLGGLGGGKILGGGGGLIGVVVLVLYLVLASRGAAARRAGLACRTDGRDGDAEPGAGAGVPHRRGRERAGGLPHRRRREQRPGVLGEDAPQLRAGRTTRFFDGQIQTGCGVASSAVGPFYCPADRHVYIDLGFFDAMKSQLGAEGGPLAEAYVLAHEYGHHIENLTGVLGSANRDTGPQGGQVRVELQADCYAGLWVGRALDTGFIEDIDSAGHQPGARCGGCRGRRPDTGARRGPRDAGVVDAGSSDQRKSWFVRGIEGSGPQSCDTFKGQV